jgi:hypothetical protein
MKHNFSVEYAERARDELRQIELHPHDLGAIELDTFMALSQVERCIIWAQSSANDRRGLALQVIRRKGHGPDEATIALYVELLDQRFGSDQTCPDRDDLLALVKERHDTAIRFEDMPGARQLDRVRCNLLSGAGLTWHLGDLLIQSINNPGSIYSVNSTGCTCPNGAAGRASCWHVALYDLLIELAEERAASADMSADAAAERIARAADNRTLGRRICGARALLLVA